MSSLQEDKLEAKLRADINADLKFFVGNDERESGMCGRPEYRLIGGSDITF